jgi:hypothetical protein
VPGGSIPERALLVSTATTARARRPHVGREKPSAERHISGRSCGERRGHRAEQDARRRTAACSRVHGTRKRATRTCRAPRCPYTAPVRGGALAAGLTTRGPCRFATGPDLIAGEPAAVAAARSADGGPGSWRLTAAQFVGLRDDAEQRRRFERIGSRRSCLAPPGRARARARAAALARAGFPESVRPGLRRSENISSTIS